MAHAAHVRVIYITSFLQDFIRYMNVSQIVMNWNNIHCRGFGGIPIDRRSDRPIIEKGPM